MPVSKQRMRYFNISNVSAMTLKREQTRSQPCLKSGHALLKRTQNISHRILWNETWSHLFLFLPLRNLRELSPELWQVQPLSNKAIFLWGFYSLTNPQGDSNGCNWCYQNKAKCLVIKSALNYNNIFNPFGNYWLGKNKVWWGTGGGYGSSLFN